MTFEERNTILNSSSFHARIRIAFEPEEEETEPEVEG